MKIDDIYIPKRLNCGRCLALEVGVEIAGGPGHVDDLKADGQSKPLQKIHCGDHGSVKTVHIRKILHAGFKSLAP